MCCGREQQSAATPDACKNLSLFPESAEARVEHKADESDNGSSTTVSASSEASLEHRQKRWDSLKSRYRKAKYLSAKLRKVSKATDMVMVSVRKLERGRYLAPWCGTAARDSGFPVNFQELAVRF